MKVLSKSLEETNELARVFLNKISDHNNEKSLDDKKATVVGLFGDLGSGKTTFSQALGKYLGISELITSPTFVIEKVYNLENLSEQNINNFKKLIHIDAYRLEKGQELEVLGFKELLKGKENLILIEWPERVIDILPSDLIKIYFKFISENEREIQI